MVEGLEGEGERADAPAWVLRRLQALEEDDQVGGRAGWWVAGFQCGPSFGNRVVGEWAAAWQQDRGIVSRKHGVGCACCVGCCAGAACPPRRTC